jgi:hypothetical protein
MFLDFVWLQRCASKPAPNMSLVNFLSHFFRLTLHEMVNGDAGKHSADQLGTTPQNKNCLPNKPISSVLNGLAL